MISELILLIASLAVVFYIWQKRTYSYWQRNGIKSIKPVPILGNLQTFLSGKVPLFEQISLLYNTPGYENEPLIGVYLLRGPGVIVRDLELVKNVMIKKFNYFVNRALSTDPHNDPLGYNNMFIVRNPEWKMIRNKLSPVFTSGKIKQMYSLMMEVSSI